MSLPRMVCEYEDAFSDELPGLPPVHPKIAYNQISATITQEVLSNPRVTAPKTCSPQNCL